MPCHRVAFVPREHSGAAPCGREGRCEGPFDAASAGPPCEPSLSVPCRWWGGRSGQRGSRAGKLACPRREKRWLWVTSRAERTSRAEALVVGPPRVPRPAWRPEAAVLSVLCHKALLARTKLPEGGAETSGQPRLDEGTASPAPGGGRVREPRVSGATRAVRHGVTLGPCSPDPQRRPQSPGRGSPVGPGPGSRIHPVCRGPESSSRRPVSLLPVRAPVLTSEPQAGSWGQCHGLDVPPTSYVGILPPSVAALGGGAFGRGEVTGQSPSDGMCSACPLHTGLGRPAQKAFPAERGRPGDSGGARPVLRPWLGAWHPARAPTWGR